MGVIRHGQEKMYLLHCTSFVALDLLRCMSFYVLHCIHGRPKKNPKKEIDTVERKTFFYCLQANNYYKMFITWTNEKIRKTFVQRNMFDFKHIKIFDKSYADQPGPMVVFATPGMLHGGLALGLFKKWAPIENNMVSRSVVKDQKNVIN